MQMEIITARNATLITALQIHEDDDHISSHPCTIVGVEQGVYTEAYTGVPGSLPVRGGGGERAQYVGVDVANNCRPPDASKNVSAVILYSLPQHWAKYAVSYNLPPRISYNGHLSLGCSPLRTCKGDGGSQ